MNAYILDCDTGIDDALGILLAHRMDRPGLLGISTVSGNVNAHDAAENTLKILHRLGRNTPVYEGELSPLEIPLVEARETHGADGLGESTYPPSPWKVRGNAFDFMVKTLNQAMENREKVDIVALGPLTNMAKIIVRAPELLGGLGRLISMGGVFSRPGNVTEKTEYNYWVDPHSAKIVYDGFRTLPILQDVPLIQVGLDMTREIVLTPEVRALPGNHPVEREIMNRILPFYDRFHKEYEDLHGSVINDPLALSLLYDPEILRLEHRSVDVLVEGEHPGRTVFTDDRPNVWVAVDVDHHRFWELFLEQVPGLSREQRQSAYALLPPPTPSPLMKEGDDD